MSGNTALAAAKRRRNPAELMNDIQSKQVGFNLQDNDNHIRKYRESTGPVHPLNLIKEHDKQVFILERKLELIEKHIFDTENSSTNNSQLDSQLEQSNNEIRLLKAALQKQNKQVTELTTIVTVLKGTISNHDNNFFTLEEELKKLSMETPKNIGQFKESETSTNGSSVKLEIR